MTEQDSSLYWLDQLIDAVGLGLLLYMFIGEPIRLYWMKWRMKRWSKEKIVGYTLLKQVDERPVLNKEGEIAPQ